MDGEGGDDRMGGREWAWVEERREESKRWRWVRDVESSGRVEWYPSSVLRWNIVRTAARKRQRSVSVRVWMGVDG